MKITILGSTGMLGNSVAKEIINIFGEDNVYLSYRNEEVAYGKNRFYFDILKSDLSSLPDSDALISCSGIIKPFISQSYSNAIEINSLFPWKLASFCKQSGKGKMIHISTDCVYTGKKGNYTEEDVHDCEDFYGKSKSLGEPNNCMVIRTSIIGEEIHKNASLIAWAKSQKGKTISGFSNHFWNGITTNQYGKICAKIIKENLYEEGLFHVFSNVVSKYELMNLINKRFDLGLKIDKCEVQEKVDRTLSTTKGLNSELNVPSLEDQIKNL